MPTATVPYSITTNVEIPEPLYCGLTRFLEQHPQWSQEQAFTAALGIFLLQHDQPDDATISAYIAAFPLPVVSDHLLVNTAIAKVVQPPT